MRNALIEVHYKEHRDRLIKTVMRRVGRDPHLAEEAVQEAYTRAMEYFHCYDPEREFEGWFVTILNNAVRDLMNSERSKGAGFDIIDEDSSYYSSETGSEDLDLTLHKKTITKAILSTKNSLHRDILDLYFNKQLNYRDIIKITEASSEDMARQVVSRFKKSLEHRS